MHFSNEEGRRVQATFTMSADRAEQFGADDLQLADSLRFLGRETTPESDGDASREVADTRLGPNPRIADNMSQDGNSSPSDLD